MVWNYILIILFILSIDMIIKPLLLSMETVQLAKIDNFIRVELQRRAEYAIKFGVSAPRRMTKPQPTRQAKLVAWHLTYRVPLNFAAIPETDIKEACERFGTSLETWRRQERAFGLLRKVYAVRAKIRGEQPPIATANIIPWP
jgi:hypothetical protein